MKTKAIFTLIALIATTSTNLLAQGGPSKKERKAKLDSLKVEFFNNSLALSETEQDKFWPLYNEYHEKVRTLKKDFRKKYKKNDLIYMSEEEAKVYLKELSDLKDQEVALYKTYQQKFLAFLSAKKVVMIYRTEREWQMKLKGMLRNRMNKGPRK